MADNALYYGDNLDILRRYIKDETIDLIYLDPPFNSQANYNVLFAEQNGSRAAAQIHAFEDTWRWDQNAAKTFEESVEKGGDMARALLALRSMLGDNDMLAYLTMMTPRLVELKRVLKSTGSIYLHCDPTASHYLKILMDSIYDPKAFRSEIVWQRSSAHNDTSQGLKQPGHVHDSLLFYTKSESWTWNPLFIPYSKEYMNRRFKYSDTKGQYKDADLSAAKPGGDTSYEWRVKRGQDAKWESDLTDEWRNPAPDREYKGVVPPSGRYWAYSRTNMIQFATQDRLHYFSTGMPRLKQYVEEMEGIALQDVWTDIPPINAVAAERLGYPTQKPLALLERIIKVSSNEGDMILDPFCGCGTTIAAAEQLNRGWIGIDITHLAISLMKNRLRDSYGTKSKYKVIGEPVSLPDAQDLAEHDPYQFQWWALGLVGARPVDQKKGADKGIDGRLYFHDEGVGGKTKQVIFSVKAGHTQAAHIRDLIGVMAREKAEMVVLISMQPSTQPMRTEAASAGFYDSPGWGKKYPRCQILTIEELLNGKQIDMPPLTEVNRTFKKAEKAEAEDESQGELGL